MTTVQLGAYVEGREHERSRIVALIRERKAEHEMMVRHYKHRPELKAIERAAANVCQVILNEIDN